MLSPSLHQRFEAIDSELDAHLVTLQCDVRHSVAAHLSQAHSALLDDVTELVGAEVQRHVEESVWPAIEVQSSVLQMAKPIIAFSNSAIFPIMIAFSSEYKNEFMVE